MEVFMFTIESVVIVPLILMMVFFALMLFFFVTEWLQFVLYTERAFLMSHYWSSKVDGYEAKQIPDKKESNQVFYRKITWEASGNRPHFLLHKEAWTFNETYRAQRLNHSLVAWSVWTGAKILE